MRISLKNAGYILLGLSLMILSGCSSTASRITDDFEFNWKFARGDLPEASERKFDDTRWRTVQIPHDWSIEGPYSQDNASCTGYLPGGVGWYRKTFRLDPSQKDKLIAVEFDGIYNNSEVWINGHYLGKRPFGYIGFQYDLTPYIRFNGSNVLSVRVDHSYVADSRWYTGSGIYRHVRLVIDDSVHITHWGVLVTTPIIESDGARINIQTRIENESQRTAAIKLVSEVHDPRGLLVKSIQTEQSLSVSSEEIMGQTIEIPDPVLWDIDNPALYTLKSILLVNDMIVDEVDTPFGIRSFYFDPDKGFFLNGRNLKLKGMCLHHDAGCLGAAVPEKTWHRRLMAMREIGCNAIRCSHNPPAPEFLDLCDQLGFLVIDEAFDEFTPPKKKWIKGRNEGRPDFYGYGEVFKEWSRRDIQDMVRRDRNHPSIILWSVGNEIDFPNDPFSHPVLGENYQPNQPPAENLTGYGRPLVEAVKELDTTRPVTVALAQAPMSNAVGFADLFDVVGYNYQEQYYETHHAQYPDRCLYGSENGRSLEAWLAVLRHDYIAGQFIWIGIDYIGEAGIWPMKSWTGGQFDLCLNKKPVGWFRQSLWAEKPMIYLACRPDREPGRRWDRNQPLDSHWNWPGESTIEVTCYTNCDEAELFLNDQSLGIQQMELAPRRQLRWHIPFAPGTLKAVGRCKGRKTAEYILQTAGAPEKIRLIPDCVYLQADGRDVCHLKFEIVDENGNRLPEAENRVTFSIEGPAEIIGIGNANPASHQPMQADSLNVWQGRGLAVIRSQGIAGPVSITASSPGLKSKTMTLTIR